MRHHLCEKVYLTMHNSDVTDDQIIKMFSQSGPTFSIYNWLGNLWKASLATILLLVTKAMKTYFDRF